MAIILRKKSLSEWYAKFSDCLSFSFRVYMCILTLLCWQVNMSFREKMLARRKMARSLWSLQGKSASDKDEGLCRICGPDRGSLIMEARERPWAFIPR